MNELRFSHLSDPHLGARSSNETIFGDYFADFEKALNLCVEGDFNPHFIILTGDLFDTLDPRSVVMHKFYEICDRFFEEHPDLYLLIIPGNHEYPRSSYIRKHGYMLELLKYSKYGENIILVDDSVRVLKYSEDEGDVALLTGLHFRDYRPIFFLQEDVLSKPENKAKFAKYPNAPKLLLLHQICSGMPLQKGVPRPTDDFDERGLQPLNFDYIGCGHYHKPWEKPQLNFYCPGSTNHVTSDEWDDPKRYIYQVTMNYDDKKKKWMTKPKRIAYDVRPKIKLEINLGKTTYEDALKKVEEEVQKATIKDSLVQIKVIGEMPTEETRILTFNEIEEKVRKVKQPVSLDIQSNVFSEAFMVSENAKDQDQILNELLEMQFKLSPDEKVLYATMIHRIRDSSSKVDKSSEIETIIKDKENEFAKLEGESK